MEIRYWMKCSFLMAFLTLVIVSTASQLNASVNTSGTYQDAGVMLLFAQDTGSDSTILLAHYTGYRHSHRYRRGYGHRGYWDHRGYNRGYRGYHRGYRGYGRHRGYGPPPYRRHRR